MKHDYPGIKVSPFRYRVGVAWACLRGRSPRYEVIVRSGDTIRCASRRVTA